MTELWPHQKAAADLIEAHGRGLLGMPTATGKTLTALELLRRWQCQQVLIVCPQEVVSVWPGEFAKHGFEGWVFAALDRGSSEKRAEKFLEQFGIALRSHAPFAAMLNYDIVTAPAISSLLNSLPFDCLILDEVHKIKSVSGKQSIYTAGLAKFCKHVIGMTGTPVHDKQTDLFGQFRTIDPSVFGTNYYHFQSKYFRTAADELKDDAFNLGHKEIAKLKSYGDAVPREMADRYGLPLIRKALASTPADADAVARAIGQKYVSWRLKRAPFMRQMIVGCKDPAALTAAMAPCTYTCRKEDVLPYLPPVVHEQRTFVLGDKAQEAYDAVLDDLHAEVEGGTVTAANVLSRSIRLRQIACGFGVIEGGVHVDLGDEREVALTNILSDLPENEQVVVFGDFREDFSAIHRAAKAAGRTSCELSGPRKEFATWQAGDANVLAVHPKTGGAGLDFTQACVQVYWSHAWSLGDYEQTLGRMDRPTQTRSVAYLHIQASGTIDEDIVAALQEKRSLAEAVLSGLRKGR